MRAATALARDNPDVPAVTAAAAHSLGLRSDDPAQLADAVAQHADQWAQASAAEDLGVLLASQAAAQGLNNGQIGDRLYISRHAVAFHLRQVFRKLQITSRVELTRVVMERGRSH